MGEVSRARDTKLHREVALKVLPDLFASDPERLARFQREAEVLAALNHPNIAAIYGLEESDGVRALVLELVEGPTLADRIAQGLVPMDEAWPITRQIAQALEAAHEQGIIHRDLKPSNIKVRQDGAVKVLDFGLAKLADQAGTGPHAETNAATLISPAAMTRRDVILGTAAYMSPEQARGKAVDRRTDVWAFGCVLYEMLTGRRAFDGEDTATVLGAVVRLEPDWHALPGAVPPAVVPVLKRCLQKDSSQRLRDIADIRLQLEDALAAPVSFIQPLAHGLTRAGHAGWVVAALVTVAAAIAIVPSVGRAPAGAPETRLQIVTPPTNEPYSFAISPDGRSVVFQAEQGRPQLWLRPLESEEARPLMGTQDGTLPFWAPDSRSVGFFADGALKRLDLTSGFVRTLASAPDPRRGTWNSDGTIVFGTASVGRLYRVRADVGAVTQATNLLPGQNGHRWPQFLPDGRQFLFLGAADVRGVYLGSLDDSSARRVSDRESAYAFMPPAHVLFARQGALWARRLTGNYTQTEGEFIPVAPKVLVSLEITGQGAFSAASAGSITYRASAGERQLVWLDRSGRVVSAVGQPEDTQLGLHQLSSDGRTACVMRMIDGNTDVWLIDTERGVSRRLTFDPAIDGHPKFSPDGSRVVYATDEKADVYQMYERRSDGTGGETLILESGENKNPQDWSADGRYILYRNLSPTTSSDLWALPLFGDRKPLEVARTRFSEFFAKFSPNGRWVAYDSTETGQAEIYVQPFPGPGAKLQLSIRGGRRPRWRRDGRELFYLAPDNRLMAVSIAQRGSSLDAAPPRGLFTLPTTSQYEPSPDGQRFLVATVVSDASPITIILNWKPPGR